MEHVIDKNPGRDLDSFIAVEIFGLGVSFDEKEDKWLAWNPKVPTKIYNLPYYSKQIEHSTGIVHWLQDRKFFLDSGTSITNNNEMFWRARFFRNPNNKPDFIEGVSLAHSICLAAIECLEQHPEDIHTLPH